MSTPFAPLPATASAASSAPSATTGSIVLRPTPPQTYLMRIGDTCLIHAQRLAEWSGHAPILEEDIALTKLALDLVGQARALLTHVGRQTGFDEDQLAFLRDERDFDAGEVRMTRNHALEKRDLDAGFILTCQAPATTREVKISLDHR